MRPDAIAKPLGDDITRVEDWMTNPYARSDNSSFTEVPTPHTLVDGENNAFFGMQLVNRMRRTLAAVVSTDKDGNSQLIIAMRGDRKHSGDKFFSMDSVTMAAFVTLLYATKPIGPCSYFP
eukprot:5359319-Prymnesium_polylepis.1